MRARDVLDFLVDRFPELRAPTERHVQLWGHESSPMLYVWVDIFDHELLWPLLDAETEDGDKLASVFGALEEMATSGDEAVHAFLQDGILEVIGDSDARLSRSRRYMGPVTRKLSDDAERLLGRSHSGID